MVSQSASVARMSNVSSFSDSFPQCSRRQRSVTGTHRPNNAEFVRNAVARQLGLGSRPAQSHEKANESGSLSRHGTFAAFVWHADCRQPLAIGYLRIITEYK